MWTTGGGSLALFRDRSVRVRERPSPRSCPPTSHQPPDTTTDDPREVLDLTERVVAGLHLVLDLLDPVEGGGVVASTEDLADLDQGQARAFPHQVHGDVPRLCKRS